MTPVTLPQLSLAMEEGKVTRWLVCDGEQVAAGQALVEIETDKAMTEIEAPAAGQIRLMVAEGTRVAVETTLAQIEPAAAAGQPMARVTPAVAIAATASESTTQSATPGPISAAQSLPSRAHRASPAARRIARERGIALSRARGTGPAGRVTARDLDEIVALPEASLRAAVVAHLAASWRDIPHIHIAGQLDAEGLRASKESAAAGTTLTDLLILATVEALRAVPELNGSLGKPSERIHLAFAVASPQGVVAPVIRNASDLSLAQITSERSRLVAAARAGASERRDLAGGTFTLSNLGAYPVDFFAPVVSGPQIAMLATGRITEQPVAAAGEVTIGHRIWANVAIDHRGADGVSGARFLSALESCIGQLPQRINARA